ncbi:MAG: CDP-alcohol phosphatidyltransferase family protein [Calditrichaeota bacterium]|nr:MAG: CDP-alcohol phosphatidyltransferase family protein [Calditrichota bacterium]
MAANIITLSRIVMAFGIIFLFQGDFYFRIIGVGLTLVVIYLDALDGIVARKLGVASDFGALFDITGDRIVEHVYWILFTALGLVNLWVPIIFISRSFLVDTLRTVAYSKEGKTPFGEKSMMRSGLTFMLTASRPSRTIYGVAKVVVFMLLGLVLSFQVPNHPLEKMVTPERLYLLERWTMVLVWVVVAMNLIRGLPVLWDGRYYLFDKKFPRELKDAN